MLFLLICSGIYVYARFMQMNHAPLDIKTFDNLNDPYHPSVKYFSEGWNGYKYWMAESPFSRACTPYRDANEIPSIHVSNDGIHWSIPTGLSNPIIKMSRESIGNLDYYSDPHIVMNGDTMEVWYRKTNRHGKRGTYEEHSLRRVSSTDGIHWSEEEVIAEFPNHPQLLSHLDNVDVCELVSPALLYSDSTYCMYYVHKAWSNGKLIQNIERSFSHDGKEWTPAQVCSLSGASIIPWHIDIQFINNVYWLIVYDSEADALTLWRSSDGKQFNYVKSLLERTAIPGPFYGNNLYRACLVKNEEKFLMYVTGDDGYNAYIGLMIGDSPETLKLISVDGNDRGFKEFIAGVCWKIERTTRRQWNRVKNKFQN